MTKQVKTIQVGQPEIEYDQVGALVPQKIRQFTKDVDGFAADGGRLPGAER